MVSLLENFIDFIDILSSGLADFITEVNGLINKLVHQIFDRNLLYKYLNRFIRNKPSCFNKYWANLNIGMFY